MMTNLGLVYGIDNAAAALALAPVLGWRRGLMLAAFFGAAEALMPLAGAALALPALGAGEAIRVGLLALLGTTIAGLALTRRDPAALIGSPAAMAGLAILLGLDNLLVGAAGASPATLLSVGLGSAALSALACVVGAALTSRLERRRAALVSSAALIAVAAASLIA
jgi:putative Mn2+ efflux pump MntP